MSQPQLQLLEHHQNRVGETSSREVYDYDCLLLMAWCGSRCCCGEYTYTYGRDADPSLPGSVEGLPRWQAAEALAWRFALDDYALVCRCLSGAQGKALQRHSRGDLLLRLPLCQHRHALGGNKELRLFNLVRALLLDLPTRRGGDHNKRSKLQTAGALPLEVGLCLWCSGRFRRRCRLGLLFGVADCTVPPHSIRPRHAIALVPIRRESEAHLVRWRRRHASDLLLGSVPRRDASRGSLYSCSSFAFGFGGRHELPAAGVRSGGW